MPPSKAAKAPPMIVETILVEEPEKEAEEEEEEEEEEDDYGVVVENIPDVKIHVRHKEGCKFTDELMVLLKRKVPDAILTHEIGEDDEFEFFANDKLIYSKRNLGRYPKGKDELLEVTRWANKGKTFMHMYLCTVADGSGESNMIIADRKNTPIAKRIILACTIQ
eukprot:maker-scaffold720_size106930-snap-gene-0.12 protein:Tk07889 transcript:maker-scaffold720_size106930-snap-gene-0.12-mRNA-1 annotation:"migration and invasion enhancer 1-like"